jgi:murein DD-endopeptidase MepM/ murein hydrolase activator NlpD
MPRSTTSLSARFRDLFRRRISIMVLAGPGRGMKQFSFPALALPAVILLIALGIAGSGAAFLTWTSARISELHLAYLKKENDRLIVQLREIRETVDTFQSQVQATAEMEREFRNIANLEAISGDVRLLGVGGPPPLSELEDQSSIFPAVREARETLNEVAQLNRQAVFQNANFREMIGSLRESRSELARIPSTNPVTDCFVTSRFGIRPDPFTGEPTMHNGVDFSGFVGAPVRATAAGYVREAGESGLLGLLVEIDHDNGMVTRYGHNSKILVSAGQRVKRGDIIAEVGSTGRSTSPHCHYEVLIDGVAVNPSRYILGDSAEPVLF